MHINRIANVRLNVEMKLKKNIIGVFEKMSKYNKNKSLKWFNI